MSFLLRILERLERGLLLRSMGIDPAAADRPAPPDDPVRDRLIEINTLRGWRVVRRDGDPGNGE